MTGRATKTDEFSEKIQIIFWIENDAPPTFSENSSVLVPLPVQRKAPKQQRRF